MIAIVDFSKDFKEKTEEKIKQMKEGDFHFGAWSEFGARRRLSYEAQDWLIGRLAEEKKFTGPFYGFIGTSNIHLASKYNLILNRLSWAISKRIRRKSQYLAEEIDENAFGIYDYDLNDMQDFCETNIVIANRYAYPRIGKVGEK